MPISPESVRERLQEALSVIRDALAECGSPARVIRVMAVTKTHPAAAAAAAIAAGIPLIGENRVSEGGRKIAQLGRESAEFHLIGPLHTGEVRQAVRDFHSIDSLDRLKVAAEIARRITPGPSRSPRVMVEVNTSGEVSKHGFPPDAGLLEEALLAFTGMGLAVSGLLTVGPVPGADVSPRRAFALLRQLRDRLSASTGIPLEELSMGMSDDFREAVLEGATTVRLGRFLFGERTSR
jgi:pyridoxal phosphate enzyme (YggS family)